MEPTGSLAALLERAAEDEEDIRGLHFSGEAAEGALARGVTFDGCTFTGCRLAGADFSRAMLFDCRFERCDLSGAHFFSCSMKNTVLDGCRISGADLREAYGSSVTFSECIGDYSNHASAVYKKCALLGGSYHEAGFFQTELRDCRLETDFTLAEFQRTQLHGANLRKCELYGASFTQDALAGVRVTREQAADLAVLMGLIVE